MKYEKDRAEQLFVYLYLGGLLVFGFLWQYKPETRYSQSSLSLSLIVSPNEWAKQQALKRMKERGVDLEAYRYKPPDVY